MATDKTPAQKAAEDREKARHLAIAFRTVFGKEGQRTPAQLAVWAHLERLGYARRTTMVPDQAGAICLTRMSAAEGHRQYFLQIEELVRHASATEESKKPEVLKDNPPT